ncbi:DHA2 family efflux MFS transporter permease subunit [Actinocrispum wychmicini]|uniref:EmrB/QacA subfamily drug resistance transporter n=1 Tax=Actinocrispum wychmicini TaxID=1213861 RepID=A0A4V2S8W4_9PSEU|nr:DHA2 family efflux MFS transporter permease subunit [Actinocrispum wychmicini]TCO65410.1 EmrB/QacA subfamily drug resistance transporter [Actinocrispum wychmicini]
MGKWSPLVAVCLGAFMLLVDITIVTVALPDMAHDLNASFTGLQWVLDAYALALAALVLGSGSVADHIGRRRVYLIGLVVFAVASLACGVAPNVEILIIARIVQGVGGAAMLATTMALINVTYHGKDRAVALGLWGAVIGIAASAGPVLGGLFTEYVHWRGIFLVNLPISVIAIWMTMRAVGESKNPHASGVDLPGVVAFTASAGAITYGLIQAGEDGWGAAGTLGWLIAGAAALVVFVVIEIRSDHSMLDLALFRRPAFTVILLAALAMSFAAFAYGPFTSIWLQNVLHMKPLPAGLALLPMSVASFLVAGTVGRHLHSVAARLTVGFGLVVIGVGALLLHTGSSWVAVLPGLAVTGLGVGVTGQALPGAMMATVPPHRAGMASGALNTFRQLGFALGVAVLGTVVRGGSSFDNGLESSYVVAGVVGVVVGVIALLFLRSRDSVDQAKPQQVLGAEV